jgi:D-3-phosphoglycerate dehydrogenase / 2-oxoglutarate reductase
MKVLVTCPPMIQRIDEFRSVFESKGIELVIPEFIQSLSEEELLELVPKVDGWIIGDDPATRNIFENGKRGKLKAAVKWGVGVDNVDFKAAEKLGIPISNTPKMFGNEVADLGICYLLSLARQANFIDREVRKGHWIKPAGISVTGKTVALIGLGDIGLACARRLKGFDVKILGYDPFISLTNFEAGIDQILKFPEKLNEADFILISCALTNENIHLINKKTISEMKDGVFIINISRGKLIKEIDLVEALESGKIKGAALDVFEEEPLDMESPLRSFEQCIFGTHNGSNTVEAVKRATEQSMSLLFGYLNLL